MRPGGPGASQPVKDAEGIRAERSFPRYESVLLRRLASGWGVRRSSLRGVFGTGFCPRAWRDLALVCGGACT
uniref:Uncharacterized protein n=1 Tax=Peronospora matthiolae TaxID=2874970 RepID=A0AAV1U5Y9_9STRA